VTRCAASSMRDRADVERIASESDGSAAGATTSESRSARTSRASVEAVDSAESLDSDDMTLVTALGYAVARAQLLEYGMLKVIEAQTHDLTASVDDRWPEIEKLMKLTAGQSARKLHLPEPVVADLKALANRRNLVAHNAWTMYLAQRGNHGDRAVGAYRDWLSGEARVFGHGYNALMTLLALWHDRPDASQDDALGVWRTHVTEPVEAVTVPQV
jgi:hypothetical protein